MKEANATATSTSACFDGPPLGSPGLAVGQRVTAQLVPAGEVFPLTVDLRPTLASATIAAPASPPYLATTPVQLTSSTGALPRSSPFVCDRLAPRRQPARGVASRRRLSPYRSGRCGAYGEHAGGLIFALACYTIERSARCRYSWSTSQPASAATGCRCREPSLARHRSRRSFARLSAPSRAAFTVPISPRSMRLRMLRVSTSRPGLAVHRRIRAWRASSCRASLITACD